MITKWIDIKSVLFELERFIPKDIYSEQRLINDCMRAVDMIGAVPTYEQKVKFIKVDNFKACIPNDCLQIIQIAHKNNFTLDDEDLQDIKEMMGFDNVPLLENSTLPLQVWMSSRFYQMRWTPLRLSTSSFAMSVHVDNCKNIGYNCNYEYSVSPDGSMTFNFKTGFICISYWAYPTDCNNNPLIPDVEDYKEALKNYCLMTSWEYRWNLKEEGAEQRYLKYQQLWGLYKAKATASLRMPDVTQAQGMQNILSSLIPRNRRFYNFFNGLTNQENLNMNGFSSGYTYRN